MHVHVESEISAPASQVWKILAHQFGDIATWSSTVETSRKVDQAELPEGVVADPRAPVAARETKSAFVTAREYFVDFDDEAMVFTFGALGLPFFLKKAENTSRVESIDDGSCRLTFDVQMDMWGPFALLSRLMKKRFTRAMNTVHADLKAYAEQLH